MMTFTMMTMMIMVSFFFCGSHNVHALSSPVTVTFQPRSATTTTTTTTTSTSTSTSSSSTAATTPMIPDQDQKIEKRSDPFGGTGLYATTDIPTGELLVHATPDSGGIVFGAIEGSPVHKVKDDICIGNNGFTQSVSIGATLASWKLFQEHYHHEHHNHEHHHAHHEKQPQSQQRYTQVPYNAETMAQAGISPACTQHAANLPWNESRWQLLSMWPPDILQQALTYGMDRALQEEEEKKYQQDYHDTSVFDDNNNNNNNKIAELQEACQNVTNRVINFQLAGDRLAEEMRPFLYDTYGMSIRESHVRDVCHQAMAMTFSRTFYHPVSNEMTLLPWIDSANHAGPNANAKLINDDDDNNKKELRSSSSSSNTGLKLVALKPISAGEEITITYHLEESGCITALSGYGFIPQNMAQESIVGRALQLTSLKGQELVQQSLQQKP